MYKYFLVTIIAFSMLSCKENKTVVEEKPKAPFVWEGANLYFLLTDRFNNGDTSNDVNFDRTKETGKSPQFTTTA